MNCKPNINNTVVFDIGLAMVRAGHAGEGFPSISQPSYASIRQELESERLQPCFNDSYLYSCS